jgi:hypothetical protein
MFPSLARSVLMRNQSRLYFNRVRLASEQTITSIEMVDDGEGNLVSSGTPIVTVTFSTHWEGKGSIQYVRPRIQKAIASENQGMVEDPISLVAYLPYDSFPEDSMMVIDIDGVVGSPGRAYAQSRKPANVGGLNVYWELYLGLGVND